MRPWRVRLAARRARVQWAFLAVVVAVSVLAATLLATLYLLSVATETFAARAALADADAQDVAVSMRVLPEGTVDEVIAGTDDTAAKLFGTVPVTRVVTTQGKWLSVPREGRTDALAYLGSNDALESLVTIRSGQLPEEVAAGPVQVIVPPAMLADLGVRVGDTITLAPMSTVTDPAEFLIVGTYTAKDGDAPAWQLDRLGGLGYDSRVAVPFTNGRVTTDGFGPLYTAQSNVEAMPVALIDATYVPDFSDTSLAEVAGIVERGSDLDALATSTIGDAAGSVSVASDLPETLGGIVGSIAVTRSSVLVTGLLLLVLAVAALSQTARLMAERRYGEQHLMIARGGSGRQLFRLGVVEAIALGVLTAVVAAPLARLVYLVIARTPVMANGGMNVDPGIPPRTWVVTGVVGVILVGVLVAPLMRRQTNFVDAEQARSRPGKRAAFQRSGLDFAVLVLAGLAFWQLSNYKSPNLTGGAVARVDPLLAAGPALALLAGALVAVRLIPPASKALEALAARGRKAVLPLAAWEVGRRSARAVSAILLLTLSVSIGAFAITFLTSWHQSQDDQALYQHPPDVIVSGLTDPALTQHELVDDGTYARSASPVVREGVRIGDVPVVGERQDDFDGDLISLVATDDVGLKTYGVGRLNEIGGARIPAELSDTAPAEANPIEIPGAPLALSASVSATISQDVGDIVLVLRAVVRDSAGTYQTVYLGQVPQDGITRSVTGAVSTPSDAGRLAAPLYLVGFQAQWLSLDASVTAFDFDQTVALSYHVSINDVAATVPITRDAVAGMPTTYARVPLDVPASPEWTGTGNNVAIKHATAAEDQFAIDVFTSPALALARPGSLALTASAAASPVPLVVTGSVLDNNALEVGDSVGILVENTVVPAYIAQRVPMVAGDTIGKNAIVGNIASVELGVIQNGGASLTPVEWWIGVPDGDVAAYTATLPADAVVTSRVDLAEDLKTDPLRVAIQATLWLVAGAAVALAALGFAVHAIVTVRAREIELAQMRAIGVLRGQLLRIVSSENALLSVIGLVFGLGLGVALSFLVAPLVSVGADGKPPLPSVIVQIPWNALGLLVAEVALVLLVSIVIVSFMLRRIKPAQMLRLGDER